MPFIVILSASFFHPHFPHSRPSKRQQDHLRRARERVMHIIIVFQVMKRFFLLRNEDFFFSFANFFLPTSQSCLQLSGNLKEDVIIAWISDDSNKRYLSSPLSNNTEIPESRILVIN